MNENKIEKKYQVDKKEYREVLTNLCGNVRNPKAPTGKTCSMKTTANERDNVKSVEEPEKSSKKVSSILKNLSNKESLKTNVSVHAVQKREREH